MKPLRRCANCRLDTDTAIFCVECWRMALLTSIADAIVTGAIAAAWYLLSRAS